MGTVTGPAVPYGAWPSPVSSQMAGAGGTRLSDLAASGESLWWLESRPAESGRVAAVRRSPASAVVDVTAPGFSVRTLVHEYGGGACLVDGEAVVFSNQADQRLWRQEPGADPVPITPPPPSPRSVRYADGCLTPDGRWVVCVREAHSPSGVANQLVAVPSDGQGGPVVVATGQDFVAAPRLSPDGRRLAWLAWDHPAMPWDSTALWVGTMTLGRGGPRLASAEVVAWGAGRASESVLQPTWSLGGEELYFVSDRTGWWNVWRWGDSAPLVQLEAEMARPPWPLGLSDLAALPDGRLACRWSEAGSDHLGLLDPDNREIEELTVPSAPSGSPVVLGDIRALGHRVACIVSSATSGPAVVVLHPDAYLEVVRPPDDLGLDPSWAPVPRPLDVPAEAGTVHGWYWPPTNPEAAAPDEQRPPLLVTCHGGPTGATSAAFDVRVAWWTSRGFAVAGVDYRGSTGHGRAYRQALRGQWGAADVEDCVAVAEHLAEAGLGDPSRMAVRGASAGGLTALGALGGGQVFAAGVSHYGVLDLESLAADTHKFESRYLDGLIGPLPEGRAAYVERSPLHQVDRLRAPVLLLQGSEDPIVPPDQARRMAAALRASGTPFAHVVFDGEGHGWRQASTISAALELELSFYAQVLGISPPGRGEQVRIENWPGPS